MSVVLQAPVPNLQTTTVLPSPDWNNSLSPQHSVEVKRAMTGFKRTYVKSSSRTQLQYQFTLSRMKALELRAFVTAYFRTKIRMRNHLGELWEVSLTSNPFDFDTGARSAGAPGEELCSITLQFEGTLIQAVSPEEC